MEKDEDREAKRIAVMKSELAVEGFDFDCVVRYIKDEHHLRTFRDLVTGQDIKASVHYWDTDIRHLDSLPLRRSQGEAARRRYGKLLKAQGPARQLKKEQETKKCTLIRSPTWSCRQAGGTCGPQAPSEPAGTRPREC
jgi:hypothetical protein